MTKQDLIDLGFCTKRNRGLNDLPYLVHRSQPYRKNGLNAYKHDDDSYYVKYSMHDCFFTFDPDEVKRIIQNEHKTGMAVFRERPATLSEQELIDIGFKEAEHKTKGLVYQYRISCRINKDNQDLIKHYKRIERYDVHDEEDFDFVIDAKNNKYHNQNWYEISTPYGYLRNLEDLVDYLKILGYAPDYKRNKQNSLTQQKTEQMSELSITGKVHLIGEVQKIKDTLEKQEIVVHTVDDKYPQFVKFETFNTTILDGLNEGDKVKVFFNIRGNEWKGKFFVSLGCWKVEVQHLNESVKQQSIEQPIKAEEKEYSDELPF